jgi:hypothetical protein
MRTDCNIDARRVKCRNSSHLGFSRMYARVGDLITTPCGLARMIGRITWAPALDGGKPIRNWICAVAIASDLSFVMERWIDPETVTGVYRLTDVRTRAVVKCFLSDDLRRSAKRDVEEVRAYASELWSTLAAYRAYMAKRKADLADYERRHSKVSV